MIGLLGHIARDLILTAMYADANETKVSIDTFVLA
jgi:hypothetical protein